MGQPDPMKSPQFAQPSTFARLPFTRDLQGVDVAFIGIPFDDGTTFRPGARFGPAAVRDGSRRVGPYSRHFRNEPLKALEVVDWGDVDIYPGYIDDTYALIQDALAHVVGHGVYPLVCGGDHSISLPILRVLAKKHGRLSLIHFDAHDDCATSKWVGSKFDHGSPFGKALEEGLVAPETSIHVGLRGPLIFRDQDRETLDMGYHIMYSDEVQDRGVASALDTIRSIVHGPSYVTFDIDAVDPAFAPGTGTPEVGGLTSREALALVQGLVTFDTVGFDLVEVAPQYDPAGITAILAANLMFEFLGALATNRKRTAAHPSEAAGAPPTAGPAADPSASGRTGPG